MFSYTLHDLDKSQTLRFHNFILIFLYLGIISAVTVSLYFLYISKFRNYTPNFRNLATKLFHPPFMSISIVFDDSLRKYKPSCSTILNDGYMRGYSSKYLASLQLAVVFGTLRSISMSYSLGTHIQGGLLWLSLITIVLLCLVVI